MPSRPGEFHPEPLTDPDVNRQGALVERLGFRKMALDLVESRQVVEVDGNVRVVRAEGYVSEGEIDGEAALGPIVADPAPVAGEVWPRPEIAEEIG